TATADGYHGTGEIVGGYGGLTSLPATLSPTPPRDAIGQGCVENVGRRAGQLQGTTEGRIPNPQITAGDGAQTPEKMSLILTEGESPSLTDRPGEILARISAFKPPIVGSVSLTILFVLLLVGVPAGVLYAIRTGFADEDEV